MGSQPTSLTASDLPTVDLVELAVCREARRNFYAFRQYMRPRMLKGWWTRQVARELQLFYENLIAGLSPTLLLTAPPQHGKSWAVVDFIAWLLGKHPEFRMIFASFSDRLGVRANIIFQRYLDDPKYRKVFPEAVRHIGRVSAVRNRNLVELPGHEGYFRNTTVRGSITGEALDLGVVDDPIKGRLEANSDTVRDATWGWLTDDFLSRFSKTAGLLMIMTRWHVDDPAGRLLDQGWEIRSLTWPAIATKDEEFRKEGEPLFPELKPLDFLLARKKVMMPSSWEAIYQQSPYTAGGNLFPRDRFDICENVPMPSQIVSSVRYWDKAGTKDGGAYTSGTLMHRLVDGRYFIEDVRRGQWSALDRETHIKKTAEIDGKRVVIYVEQEPGSGGKESAESTIRMLSGWTVKADRVTGDKVTRAEPYAAQVQGENVQLLRAAWNMAFLDEHEKFPGSRYKDQVDSTSGAFAKLSPMGYAEFNLDDAFYGDMPAAARGNSPFSGDDNRAPWA